MITVFESLHPIETLESSKTELRYKGWVDSNDNKKTFAIFTDYQVGKGVSAIGGAADARNTSQEEKDICKINGDSCSMLWGNAVVYYRTGKNLHALVHELGHSFGLAHTFQRESDVGDYVSPAYSFYRGYTDNLMDYNDKANPSRTPRAEISNPFEGNMRALFKWQWDILRSDRSMNYFDTE
ncbi:hypothetical protein EI164_15795 [Psychrobacter sp. FME13]|uniref:M12 family metallo-peptidase n=1 Tax=Psychrobacter sp. FME13 TaxID=2487708 RepID=UPI00178892CE|nr:M12 family metallo-peptidase [Psychrobacter sp. FME13]MBE0443483.1 hypothetical protein [Psychrobacter sp. FME13]